MRGTIGLDDYPIFDEAYRAGLNQKILDHYADHEIGMESVPKFLHAMRRKMNEIMPMYNQLYESAKLKIDPLNTISMSTVANALGTQTTNSESSTKTADDRTASNTGQSSGQGQVVQSEFPQTQLERRKDYATAGSDSTNISATEANSVDSAKGSATGTESGNAQTTDKTDSTIQGWQGSQALLLMQFRATFLNIDMDIINELPGLFMFVWNNGDQYTNQRNGIYYP